MDNVDGKEQSILYVASQSGRSKILDLLSEQTWCTDLLENMLKNIKNRESLKTFVGNVCVAGYTRLAKILLEQDRDLFRNKTNDSSDHNGTRVTPLMR